MRSTDTVITRGLLGLVALAALGIAAPAHAQEVLTSSPNQQDIAYPGDSSRPPSVAFAFILSDGPWNLLDITVRMSAELLNGDANSMIGSLWSDNGGGLPGTQIAALSLTAGTQGTVPSPLTYSPTGTVALTANTRYWFVARAEAPGKLEMGVDFSNTNNGLHGTNSELATRDGDGDWFNRGVLFPDMTVRGIRPTGGTNGGGGAVPEPSEWAAMGVLGLALGGLVVRKRRTR